MFLLIHISSLHITFVYECVFFSYVPKSIQNFSRDMYFLHIFQNKRFVGSCFQCVTYLKVTPSFCTPIFFTAFHEFHCFAV